jgi:uncharacterized membrane protein
MLKYILAYLATGLSFAAVDVVWLSLMGPRLYRPTLDPILAQTFAPAPAIVFYLAYVLGVLVLAVLPAAGWTRALVNGALLGAMCYATYDLTNQATMKVWATRITLLDIGWGAFATALAATAGYFAFRWAARLG